jgi:hypothetical protein
MPEEYEEKNAYCQTCRLIFSTRSSDIHVNGISQYSQPTFQIFGLLHPLDLLYLAGTNKLFRTFLIARSSSRLWKTALQQIAGLPECPGDLNLIAYSRLVFDRTCYVSR